MAKKKTAGLNETVESPRSSAPPPSPRRGSTRGGSAAAAAARANDLSAAPLSSGNGSPLTISAPGTGVVGTSSANAYHPTYDQIAEAAYRRYLSRGGNHGQDFEDWIEAERELRERK